MPGQSFERDIVHAFNNYFERARVSALAYRHYQMRYQPQLFDVLVDSKRDEFYLALECKSIDVNSVNGLYFKKHFSWKGDECQVTRESDWLDKTGRIGFLVCELRRGLKKRTTTFFVPWRFVRASFERGNPSITADQITVCPAVDKKVGKYLMEEEFIDSLVQQLDKASKPVKRATWKRR